MDAGDRATGGIESEGRVMKTKVKHASSVRLSVNAGIEFPLCGMPPNVEGPRGYLNLDLTAWPQGEVVHGKQVVTCKRCLALKAKGKS